MAIGDGKELVDVGTDIFTILKDDHGMFGKIIEQLNKAADDEKEGLLSRLDSEIIRHTEAEEKYFYPKMQADEELAALVEDALADHEDIRDILQQMESQEAGSEKWLSNCEALEDTIDFHVDMEEEEIFPRARKLLSEEELSLMKENILAEKKKSPQPYRHRDIRPPTVRV